MWFIELTTRLFRDLHEMEIKGHTLRTVTSLALLRGHGPGPHDDAGPGAWPPIKK